MEHMEHWISETNVEAFWSFRNLAARSQACPEPAQSSSWGRKDEERTIRKAEESEDEDESLEMNEVQRSLDAL